MARVPFENDLKRALYSVLRKVPPPYKLILWFYVPFPSVSQILLIFFKMKTLQIFSQLLDRPKLHEKWKFLGISAVNVDKSVDFSMNLFIN